MNKVNRACPICTQNGKQSILELRQINLTEAVYICEDRNCIYPIGFQWDYVKNNILEDDSDDSSDETSKSTVNIKPEINQIKTPINSVKTTNTLNIISNVLVKNSDQKPQTVIVNPKRNIEILQRPADDSIRKNNARININKNNNNQNEIPESVIQNAKALSKYFSNQTEKPKNSIKSVFDIIQQPINVQSVNSENEIKDEKINNTFDNAINSSCIEIKDEINHIKEEKPNNELNVIFDDFFNVEEKCDDKNLDLTEMDDFLSFL